MESCASGHKHVEVVPKQRHKLTRDHMGNWFDSIKFSKVLEKQPKDARKSMEVPSAEHRNMHCKCCQHFKLGCIMHFLAQLLLCTSPFLSEYSTIPF